VLTIFRAGQGDADDTPWFYEGTTAELFRTVRVIGEQVVFVEVSPGHLINVAHIERIADDVEQPDKLAALLEHRGRQRAERAALPGEVRATPIPGGPASCPHGYITGTCSRCATEAGTTLSEQTRREPGIGWP
jgi:hypothetical protein